MDEKNSVISIITVCINCQDTIQKTLESVISQQYPYIQYIVIDGGSTDDTLTIIGKYTDRISLVVSERDFGIYDAMNKGLQYARGEIIYFLNSGDRIFAPETIERIVAEFRNNPDVALIHGDVIRYGEMPNEYCSMNRENPVIYYTQGLCHQSLFARRKVIDLVGNFDIRFSVLADRDWLFRCLFQYDVKITHIVMPVCYYLTGGFSSRKDITFFKEKLRVLLKYFFNKRVIIQLIKHPRELLLVLGMMAYSQVNIISIAVFHRTFRML